LKETRQRRPSAKITENRLGYGSAAPRFQHVLLLLDSLRRCMRRSPTRCPALLIFLAPICARETHGLLLHDLEWKIGKIILLVFRFNQYLPMLRLICRCAWLILA
jgi:hypothetical protein